MNLDKRQKVLVGIFAGVLLLWQGSGIFWGIFFGPFDDRYKQIDVLDALLKQKRKANDELELSERRMRIWERRSLPPNPVVASTLYHHWILDLANTHKLERLVVTPKKINSGATNLVFTRIPISVTAECKMDQLCKFLYDFYHTDLMHKVTQLAIESQDYKSNPTFKVTMELEGLSLASARSRTTLFADKQDKAVSDAMAKKTLDDYKDLTDKNRFVRGYNGPPAPIIPPAPPAAPFDSSPHVFLIASIIEPDGHSEAWLYDRSSNQRTVLLTGKDFEISGVKGKVLEIGKRSVKLKVRDKDWQLEVGENLKQMVELKADAAVPADGTAAPSAEPPAAPKTTVTPVESPTVLPPATPKQST